MMIATGMTIAVVGAILTLVNSAQAAFQTQGDVADLQQRLRAMIDVLTSDVRRADGIDAPVRPYRVGAVGDDFAAGVYFRADTITVFHVQTSPAGAPVVATHTYYLKPDATSFDVMQYDGLQTDLPIIDHVASLAFEYFGNPRAPQLVANDDPDTDGDPIRLDPAILVDGPWWQDQSGGGSFDADLLRLRYVGVKVRLRSPLGARLVPDLEIEFRVALRNRTSEA
jgi:hypothetical protein